MTTKHSAVRRAALQVFCIALLVGGLGGAVASANSDNLCWGCVKYECTYGFASGGYLCEMGDVDCTLVATIFFGCKSHYCRTSDACPLAATAPPRPQPEEATAGRSNAGAARIAARPTASRASKP